MRNLRKENRREFYFVLYLFQFSLLKPIIATFPQYSKIILLGSTFFLVLSTMFFGRISKVNFKRFILLAGGGSFWILFDVIFRYNHMQGEILYSYIIYAIIPLFMLSSVKNYTAVLKYYLIFSIIVGVLFLVDPFMGYQWSGDYMQFGFGAMLPAFCGSVIGVFYFKNKKMYSLMLVFFAEMFVFSNKSSFFTAGILLVVAYICFNYRKGIRWKRLIGITIMVLAVYLFRIQILDTLISIAESMGYYSYSLTTIRILLSDKGKLIWEVRFSIWRDAFEIFCKSPMIGQGVGYMESLSSSSGYAHNIVLDILVSSGVIGIMVYIGTLFGSVKAIFKCSNYAKKVFMLILLVVWFVPMQFSLTLWKVIEFWVYWGVILYYDQEIDGGIIGKPQHCL